MEEKTEVTNYDLLQALNTLNENSVATNNSIKELQEYFIIKDRQEKQKEETEKKQSEQAEKQEAEIKEQKEQEEQSALAEQSAKADAQTETYTELLTGINESNQLNNQIMAAQSIYFGIVIGLLFIKIFIDRLIK